MEIPIGYSGTHTHSRRNQQKLFWYGAILVVVVFVLFGTAWGGYLASVAPQPPHGTTTRNTGVNTNSNNNNNGAVSLPIQFSILDKWAGGGVNAPTVTVYSGQTKLDSGSASSAGIYTTTSFYTPGESLNVLVSKGATHANQYFTVNVPQTSIIGQGTSAGIQVYPIVLNFWTLGTYTLTMVDNFGNTYSTGACFNGTSGTGSQCGGSSTAAKPGSFPATLTVNIYDSVTNTGYTSSYDPINNVNWNAFVVMSSAGAASVRGYGSSVQRGSTTYYLTQVPDSNLACIQIGQTITGCSTSVSYTIAAGTITHGNTETETINFYTNFGSAYFAANGVGSPSVITAATAVTIKIAM